MSEPKQIGQNTEGYAKVVHREFPTGEEYLLKSSQAILFGYDQIALPYGELLFSQRVCL